MMNLSLNPQLLIAFALAATACSTSNESQESTHSTVPAGESRPVQVSQVYSVPEAAVVLEDVYATSVNTAGNTSFIAALFDQDPATFWATKAGAGPDEGLMLYFAEPTFIKEVRLVQAKSVGEAQLKQVEVYVNGNSVAQQYIGQPIVLEQPARSLFIRFISFGETTFRSIPDGELQSLLGASLTSAEPGYTNLFPKDKFAALSDIVLTGKNGDTLHLMPPLLVPARVTASSSLAPAAAYGVQQLFDGRKEIAWSEGAPGNGVGETIDFAFDEPMHITGLQLFNGFQRSAEHFEANGRAKTIQLQSDTNQFSLALRDAMGAQTLNFNYPINTRRLSLSLSEIYAGSKYADLVLSELSFRQGEVRIKPVLGEKASLEAALEQQAKGTVLASVLNRNLNLSVGEMDVVQQQSFTLRSDYTFVYYKQESLYDYSTNTTDERVADGNWEIKHLSPDSVVIRVFGKLSNTSKRAELYVGNTEESQTRIFQDFVTITAKKIEGERFIDPIGIYE